MRSFSVFLSLVVSLQYVASKGVISNIIVLMMENRSFDHLLGWLKKDFSSKIDGLEEGQTCPRDPSKPELGSVPITRNGYDTSPDDPLHDFDNIAVQINNDAMNGFVLDSINNNRNETNPVNMFDTNSAPIINELAKEFAVFDRWFCSIPGPTDPNRAFAMSGTSMGVLNNFNGTLWSQQSYFDYLRVNGHSFAGYYQDDLWALGYFEDTNEPENSVFIKDLEKHFYADVAAGALPEFTWLQPRMNMHGTRRSPKPPAWQHPDASITEGERLIKSVYEALRAGPKWKETLFIITYDEHGGFYDHVVPPRGEGVVPAPDEAVASNGFAFDQLGLRIPTIAISPWIPAGTVVSEALPNEQPTPTSAFESTSVLATANILLGLADEGVAPLGDRMSWANTFATIVDSLEEPRTDCPEVLSALPDTALDAYDVQRSKGLHEHIISEIAFYCAQNYPELHAAGTCPPEEVVIKNQGQAADWLQAEFKVYREKKIEAEESMRK